MPSYFAPSINLIPDRMKKYILVIYMMAAGCTMLTAQTKNTQTLMPLTERVNVQADSARINQIIDGAAG